MIRLCAWIAMLAGLTMTPVEGQTVVTSVDLDRVVADRLHNGVELPSTWLFQSGDDLLWADPNLDDSAWRPIRLGYADVVAEWSGIGWFRLHLTLPPDASDKRLALVFEQVGATEVYVDGKLVGSIGRVSGDESASVEMNRFSNPKIVPVHLSAGTHTIAIRHTGWWTKRHPVLAAGMTFPGEVMRIGIARFDEVSGILLGMAKFISLIQMLWGVPFALALVHYFIYVFNRRAKEHLDYGFFAESIAGMVFFPFQSGWSFNPWTAVVTMSLFKWSLICSAYFGLRFSHRVFDEEIPAYQRYARVAVYVLCAFSFMIPLVLYYVLALAGFVAMAGIVFRALLRGREGAPIVMTGILFLTIGCSWQVLMDTQLIEDNHSFPFIYGVLFLTLTMSIHLARSYARTHNHLAFQIDQVESLTEQTVQQEREAREEDALVRARDAEREILEAESAARTKELQEARARQQVLEELESSNHALRETQSRLIQSERMAVIGNLIAGIAHEINTPVGAIYSSHDTFVRATRRLQDVLGEPSGRENEPAFRALRVIGEANRVITTGTERVTEIVKSLRNFARLDEAEMKRADVHAGLNSTLTLVHHNLKGRVEVIKDYGELPEIVCFPSRLNQVFLNILTNAAQAITDKGTITIQTHVEGPRAVIEISDTGRGIDEANMEHIFESGFTTKPAGEGTGLGLAISKQIVDDHGGEIDVTSRIGEGTTFRIRLPLSGKQSIT